MTLVIREIVMKTKKILVFILGFCLIVSCSENDNKVNINYELFTNANIAFQNGEFEKATKNYIDLIKKTESKYFEIIQFANFQLARIYFSQKNFEQAMFYAMKISDPTLYVESNFIEEVYMQGYNPADGSSEEYLERTEIANFYYSLYDRSKTIIGLIYIHNLEYDKSIASFEEITDQSKSYYYLALAYGLKGNIEKEREYYEKNLLSGAIGLIKTREWLKKNKHIK